MTQARTRAGPSETADPIPLGKTDPIAKIHCVH